ncbi:unnamed protein product [Lepeophtheirus salmonis]|uniref:(salmon louse) hypothetical protein n=1 Tax=Lepeophtheirus salmonis TaxID=72036 RepID=A0A7R8CKD8_LEPSM|nr:unnamed protein product [Lepeophtheirus salmonis]CAF2847229.1 unnamed protein product [Lepeophtheirus salmonis]
MYSLNTALFIIIKTYTIMPNKSCVSNVEMKNSGRMFIGGGRRIQYMMINSYLTFNLYQKNVNLDWSCVNHLTTNRNITSSTPIADERKRIEEASLKSSMLLFINFRVQKRLDCGHDLTTKLKSGTLKNCTQMGSSNLFKPIPGCPYLTLPMTMLSATLQCPGPSGMRMGPLCMHVSCLSSQKPT